MKDNTVGERIKKLRKEKHLTQKQLAELVGCTNITICRYEKGLKSPEPFVIRTLANVLGCETGYLDGSLQYPTREVTDIAAALPLDREAIEQLLSLKKDCKFYDDLDVDMDDSHLLAYIINQLLRIILDNEYTGGLADHLLELVHEMIEAIRVTSYYEPKKTDKGYVMKVSSETLHSNPPEDYRMSKWKSDSCKEAICNELKMPIYDIIHTWTIAHDNQSEEVQHGKK